MIKLDLRFYAQVAARLGINQANIELEAGITWEELFSYLEKQYGLSLYQGVITLVNGKSIWALGEKDKQIVVKDILIKVFPALAGG